MPPRPPPDAYKPGVVLTVGSHQAIIQQYFSEGGFAHVYKVEISPKVNGTSVACLKRVAVPDKQSLNNLRAEVDSMKRLSGYRHVVSYIDSHAARRTDSEGYEVFVLMEFCANKGLIDFMNTRLQNRLTEAEVLRIMGEVTEGVANMHALSPPLIHRDIKIENVLISENGDYKLCDFGSASPVLRPPRNSDEFAILQNDVLKNTTPQYRSPEMIDLYKGLPIDEKSDIWALGVFLYKLCYYTTPFEAKGEVAILHADYQYPPRPVYSDRLKNLISVLLRVDPRRRPNAYQTLEEVCKMRGVATPITDYTKKVTLPPQSQPVSQPQHIQSQQQPQQIQTRATVPSFNARNALPKQYLNVPATSFYNLQASSSSTNLSLLNGLKPVKSLNGEVQHHSYDKPDPFKDLKQHNDLKKSSSSDPTRLTSQFRSNVQNLNKSLGSLTLNDSSSSVPPIIPNKPKYVDSVVQTEDPPTRQLELPNRFSRSTSRPKSMYATPSNITPRSTSEGSTYSQDVSELKKIITGLSRHDTNTIELSPGEKNHIDSSVDFLRNLEQQDSGKSWKQQTTGGSINSLRHISTGNKKRNSLISQFTGRFSRPASRNSSRASSIHESAGIYSNHTGNSIKFRSSSESIEEETLAAAAAPPPPPRLKRSSSIQKRVQALLNKSNDPPIIKTARGYGNDALKESNSELDDEGFKKPALLRGKKPTVPPKPTTQPQTPPLSAQSTPSTVTRTPKSRISSINEQSPSTLKKTAPATLKKGAPPPKPKKPSYLKAPATNELHKSKSNESLISSVVSDDYEEKFEERYPAV